MWSRLIFLGLIGWGGALAGRAAEVALPPRPAGAEGGAAFAQRVAALDVTAREEAVVAEVRRGNVPAFWRKWVDVPMDGAVIAVAPEYLGVGSDEDYWLAPLTPATAQRIADDLGCVLPTRKMVNAIWRAALKLEPAPLPPSPEMTTAAVFTQHNGMVRRARAEALAQFPPGALVAGHKKDVVITPKLATAPGKVAIYGWHRPDGSPIQPLFTGHAATWVDYSHGIRLVKREMTLNGRATTVDAVLADPMRCEALSDEGPIAQARYEVKSGAAAGREEKLQEMNFDSGVRAVINVPARLDPAKPTKLVIYGAPAGNTIEQTMGRKLAPGDDWHFDIQHIAAQTRWLRARMPEINLVVAYVQAKERSFVLWKRAQPEHPKLAGKIVDALKGEFPGAALVLTGHSAGGAFTFSYLDGVEKIPDDVERIAFLDSNYAYETEKGHGKKLVAWLKGEASRRLCVLAYQDYLALLDGKTFVSENGGTWGRSLAMRRDFAAEPGWAWERGGAGSLQKHTALGGRVEFLLKENPEKAVLHTRQVELNGFIQGMLAGTEREGQGYVYLGERVYGEMIGEK